MIKKGDKYMIKNLFGKDNSADGLKIQVEKIHQTILKYADKRSELLVKLDTLKGQRTDEMLASIDAEDVPVSSKIRKQIIEVQEQIEEIEVSGRELLKRKRATIKEYFAKTAEEAESEFVKLNIHANTLYEKLEQFKAKQLLELKEQEAKYNQAAYLRESKRSDIEKLSKMEIKSKYILSGDVRDGVVEDPFFGALPWDWDKALIVLEDKKKNQLAALANYPNRNIQINCNEEIIIGVDGNIENIDCSVSSAEVFKYNSHAAEAIGSRY